MQNNVMDNEVFEKSEQQIQSLIMHWISLFISDIDSNVTTEHLPKILNYFIRHLVKVLNFIEYPSAPYCLIVILRTLVRHNDIINGVLNMRFSATKCTRNNCRCHVYRLQEVLCQSENLRWSKFVSSL